MKRTLKTNANRSKEYHYGFLAVAFVLSLLFSSFSHADSLIVLSKNSLSYTQVADSIKENSNSGTAVISLENFNNGINVGEFETVVAVGYKAASVLYTDLPYDKKLLISFIPKHAYRQLLNKHRLHLRTTHGNVSAVFLDQPFSRKIALARLIKPEAKVMVTALGASSASQIDELLVSARKYDFTLKYETLTASDNPIQKLQPLINSADIFLSLPDSSVFNRTTAKWILYISYRQNIPIIGFSKKYVDAGALAAVYATPEQIGKHTAEIINNTQNNGYLPKPKYSKYYTVVTNLKAAATLGIRIPSSDMLEESLRGLEK